MEKLTKKSKIITEQISVSVIKGTKEKLECLSNLLNLSNSKLIEMLINELQEDELKKIYLNYLKNKVITINKELQIPLNTELEILTDKNNEKSLQTN